MAHPIGGAPVNPPAFSRYASFSILDPVDFDDLPVGSLFATQRPEEISDLLADTAILTRDKPIYVKRDGRRYSRFTFRWCEEPRLSAAETLNWERVSIGDMIYEQAIVTQVCSMDPVTETLPEWAIQVLEWAAAGDPDEGELEKLHWELAITPQQEQWMHGHRLSLLHIAERRYPISVEPEINEFMRSWNLKLGEDFWEIG